MHNSDSIAYIIINFIQKKMVLIEKSKLSY